MKRYYFDLRDEDGIAVDDEGIELPDMDAVQKEAAVTIAAVARDVSTRPIVDSEAAVEVRDDTGAVMAIRLTIAIEIMRSN
jgi:hypothetical protein